MTTAEDVKYRMALAEGFLGEARQDLPLERRRSTVDNAQLAVENCGISSRASPPRRPSEPRSAHSSSRGTSWPKTGDPTQPPSQPIVSLPRNPSTPPTTRYFTRLLALGSVLVRAACG